MPATYDPITTTTFNNSTGTYTFSSISSSYTDLRLVIVGTTGAGASVRLRFNGDTSALYSATYLGSDGTSVSSLNRTAQTSIPATELVVATSTTSPISLEIDIMSYSGSTNKTCLSRVAGDLNGSGGVECSVGLYRSTSAISSITFFTNSGTNFNAGSATLYGILRA
jgi:hypothetical protein